MLSVYVSNTIINKNKKQILQTEEMGTRKISNEEKQIVKDLAKEYQVEEKKIWEMINYQLRFLIDVNASYKSGQISKKGKIMMKEIGVFRTKKYINEYNEIKHNIYSFTFNDELIECSIEELYRKICVYLQGKTVKFFSRRKIFLDIRRTHKFKREGEDYKLIITMHGTFIRAEE